MRQWEFFWNCKPVTHARSPSVWSVGTESHKGVRLSRTSQQYSLFFRSSYTANPGQHPGHSPSPFPISPPLQICHLQFMWTKIHAQHNGVSAQINFGQVCGGRESINPNGIQTQTLQHRLPSHSGSTANGSLFYKFADRRLLVVWRLSTCH